MISDESNSLVEAISILENKMEILSMKRRLGNASLGNLERISREFHELTRKFMKLKESEKTVEKNNHQKRKIKLLNKLTQTDDDPVRKLSDAKVIIANCMLRLLEINHLIDGNDFESAVIRKLLTDQCFDNSQDIFNIQSLSVGPVSEVSSTYFLK
ncbi:uncharacterized protein [Fopius arisanus]|nr:PREDICTED: uncharacterized protein LOC105273110 isoform X2 [Fopius arisanus]